MLPAPGLSVVGQESLPALRRKVREDVASLLKFGVKKPGIDIPKEFLAQTVPLLYRKEEELAEADYIQLWNAYNQLSQWLKPVTPESIAVADELSNPRNHQVDKDLTKLAWGVVVIVLLVFSVQIFSTLIDKSLQDFRVLSSEYEQVVSEEKVALQSMDKSKAGGQTPGAQNGQVSDTATESEPLRSIRIKKSALESDLLLSAETQCKLQYLEIPSLPDIKLSLAGARPFCDDPGQWIKTAWPAGRDKACSAGCDLSIVREVANSGEAIHTVFNGLVLPLLLGLLGAAAYLTRATLNQVAESTFARSWRGRMPMRLILGGLLGVLGPQLYTAGKMESVGLGLSLFAFLLGYSVDLAFALFDRLIATIQKAFKPDDEKSVSPAATTAEPSPKPAAGIAHPARPKLAEIRGCLRELELLGPILERTVPTELFEHEIKPRLEAARALATKVGPALDASNIEPALLEQTVAEAEAACAEFTGEKHPLAIVLTSALQSFDDVANAKGADLALSMLAASIKAFTAEGAGVYDRWMAYLLAQPFTQRLAPAQPPNPEQAIEIFARTSIFSRAFKNKSQELANSVLEKALTDRSTDQLAAEIWELNALGGFEGKIQEQFASLEEFEEGWEEYRLSMIGFVLETFDFAGLEISPYPLSELLSSISKLRENPASARDLDILGHLVGELLQASTTNTDLNLDNLLQRMLRYAEARRDSAATEGEA